MKAEIIERPLPWQSQGLQQTATGYGRKLTTPYMVRVGRYWRRVYNTCFSNSGTLWIQEGDHKRVVDLWRDNDGKLQAELEPVKLKLGHGAR